MIPANVDSVMAALLTGKRCDYGADHNEAITWLIRARVAVYDEGVPVLCPEAGPLRPVAAVYIHFRTKDPVFVIDPFSRIEPTPEIRQVSYYHDGILWHRPAEEFFGWVDDPTSPGRKVRRFEALLPSDVWEKAAARVGSLGLIPCAYIKLRGDVLRG